MMPTINLVTLLLATILGVVNSAAILRPSPRYVNAEGEDEWPDEVLLPGFLALQASDLAGFLVSNMAFKMTKALLYMLWL